MAFGRIQVGVSQDGTAGDAELFMALWDKIITGKRFRDYDWTNKADPEAAVLAWRFRTKMPPFIEENVFVANSSKLPSSPNFAVMLGSVGDPCDGAHRGAHGACIRLANERCSGWLG